ncbi:MAG: hypothetical protein JNG84_11265 [Archangium sp.]|nr:hypothetical protein [Archangium sp.]
MKCARCDAELPRGATYYRYALALEAECEVIDGAPGEPVDPDQLLRQLDGMDAAELEAQVHETLSGVVCPACRRAWVTALRPKRDEPLVQ